MRRIVYTLLLLFVLPFTTQAQTQYLYRVIDGDTVRYTYTPKAKALSGKSDYTLYASVRLFAYGMAAEYAAANGEYEAAAVWDKKYKSAITAAYRNHKAKKIRARRWV